MSRRGVLVYAVAVHLVYGAALALLLDFIAGTGYLRALDDGPTATFAPAIAIDLALIAAFGVSHSVLARPAAKRALTRILPPAAERATYVLVASITLAVVVWQWRALPAPLWRIDAPAARFAVYALQLAGVALALWSMILANYGEFFGLRQAWLHARGEPHTPVPFVERSLYRYVRHPLMVGLALWMWAAPTMSVGHLVFAGGMTAYIAVGVVLEERGLAAAIGEPYRAYRARVRAFVPLRRR